MSDLVRARTEIECMIRDYQQAGESGEARRQEISEELSSLEERINDASEKLDGLVADLEERVEVERQAKET